MATLMVMARDIYPHDRLGDQYYAVAMKGYDTAEEADAVEAGIAALDAAAAGAGYASYAAVPWEADRVAILRGMEGAPFFQKIRGGMVTGLYNQKEVWPLFGYEGESFSQGRLHRPRLRRHQLALREDGTWLHLSTSTTRTWSSSSGPAPAAACSGTSWR